MTTLALRGAEITLAQAVKAAGLAESGGQAKQFIREGMVKVNGVVANQPGRKLAIGDCILVAGAPECTITAPDGTADAPPAPTKQQPDQPEPPRAGNFRKIIRD